MSFEHELDTLLKEASITAPNENARLWADAYSASGKITLSSGKTSLQDASAVGIGGIFPFSSGAAAKRFLFFWK